MKKTLLVTLMLCLTLMLSGQLFAQGNIIFISRPDKVDTATGENPDKPFIDDLKAAGYTVDTMNSNALEAATQTKIDSLNNADLVIIGRSTNSGDFGGTHKAAWNNIEAPLMCLHLWALRTNRMNWFNSSSAPHYDDEGVVMNADILKPADPVFAGVTLTDGQLPWAVGPYDVITVMDGGNGEVLATSAVDGTIQFARFDPWVEFFPGAGDMPHGYRTFIGNGNDNLRGPDGSTVIFNYYNFTPESKLVYMAEVARMVGLGKVPKPVKNIIFVSRPDKLDASTGEHADKPHIDDLIAAGYNVDLMIPTALEAAPQSRIDSLNNADLVIIGRSTNSGDFGGAHKAAWNAVEAPVLCLHLWALRTNRMNWFKSNDAPHYDTWDEVMDAEIKAASDPVFAGLTLVDGKLPWAVGPYDVITITDGGNGQVLATSAVDGSIQFARFKPWIPYYAGGVDYPAGYRTYIGNGNDATADPATQLTYYNYNNFTDESKQVYLAEVERMVFLSKVPKPEKTIVFVSRPDYFDQINQIHPDQPFIDDLQAEGYNVITWYNTNLIGAPKATLDTLNNADLVIMGRSTPSTMYQNENKIAWNAVEAPILNVELWNCRSSRLNWFKSTKTEHEGDLGDVLNATMDLASDPVFAGIVPDANGEIPWCVGPYDLLREKTAGNGQVVARAATDSSVLFVRFNPWVEFFDGSVDKPAGYRSMIGHGNDATTDAAGLTIYNYYNFTDESKMVYLAEVERMVYLGKVPKPAAKGTIVYVSLPTKMDALNGVHADSSQIDALVAAGYDVITFYNNSLETASQATVDTLNNADLVIVGRSGGSGDFGGTHKVAWNRVRAPMLVLHNWALRNSRMNWFNSGTCTHYDDAGVVMDAVITNANDYVFTGLNVVGGDSIPWAVGPLDVISVTDGGNAKVLAISAVDSSIQFCRFDPFVEFYEGAVDMPFGHRTMLGNGNDATADATTGQTIFNYKNWTTESESIFMKEVERMVGLGIVDIPDWVGVEENTHALPMAYELKQNYPNPFNPSTQIEFVLARPGHTSLVIYNVMGQVVQTLVNKNMDAGRHTVQFNAAHLASGMYFYRLKSNDKVMIKKLMLLK
ncbi:T9SS type A sorting domain-containing protein [bacterium]|nr:T9SS type A sorting domain-containing protein [bacterium]